MNSSTSILFNSRALNALQRKQLVSLCKRYHLKASGKNTDLVGKLQAFANALPAEAQTDPSFSLASFSSAPPSSDGPSAGAPRQSEAWELLDEVTEESGSWNSAYNGEEGGGEFGTRKKGNSTSLSKSTAKSFKSMLATSLKRSTVSSKHSSRDALAAPPPVVAADDSMDVDDAPASPQVEPGVARALRPSLAGTEPTIRMVSSTSGSSLASHTAGAAPTPPRMAPRKLVDSPFCYQAPASSSSSSTKQQAVYPSLPTASSTSTLPGSFPGSPASSTSRVASPPPFVFGNPRHSISNQQFRSPTIAAATSTKSMREVMEEEMRKVMEQKAAASGSAAGPSVPVAGAGASGAAEVGLALPSWMEALGRPGGTVVGAMGPPVGGAKGAKRRFDEVHDKEFAKMPSIADHYSARRPTQTPATPSASTSSRPKATPSQRRTSLVANGAPRYRPSSVVQIEGPSQKKVRVSFAATGAATAPGTAAATAPSVKGKEREVAPAAPKVDEAAEREKEKEAVKRKLAMSKARRSSVAGGRRVSGGKAPLPPKGATSRFGFLHSGVEAMRKGVASFLPRSTSTSSVASNLAASTSGSMSKSSSIPKLSSLLAKEKEKAVPTSVVKAEPSKPVSTSAPNRVVSSSKKFFGGGSKPTKMAPPPPSSTSFQPSRLNAIPSSSSVNAGLSSSARPPIPSFGSRTSMAPPPLPKSSSSKSLAANRVSTVSSVSSRAPSVKSNSSISSRPTSTRSTLTTQMVAPRPNSSLFAPTASSLARQHASVKVPAPAPIQATAPAPAPIAAVVSTRPVTVIKPAPPLAAASLYPSLPAGRRLVPKKSFTSLSTSSAPSTPGSTASSSTTTSFFPSLSAVQPLFPSLTYTVNLPAPPLAQAEQPQQDAPKAAATPKPYRPQLKARVASKLASSSTSHSLASQARTPGGKKRSSVSASMHASSRPGAVQTPRKHMVGAEVGGGGAVKARKSVPTAGFGGGVGNRRETILGGKEKGRGRRSEAGLVGLGRGVGVGGGTPARMKRVRE